MHNITATYFTTMYTKQFGGGTWENVKGYLHKNTLSIHGNLMKVTLATMG
jgi:hypothetical protein